MNDDTDLLCVSSRLLGNHVSMATSVETSVLTNTNSWNTTQSTTATASAPSKCSNLPPKKEKNIFSCNIASFLNGDTVSICHHRLVNIFFFLQIMFKFSDCCSSLEQIPIQQLRNSSLK